MLEDWVLSITASEAGSIESSTATKKAKEISKKIIKKYQGEKQNDKDYEEDQLSNINITPDIVAEKDGQRHTNKSISFSISSLQSRGGIPKPDPSSHSG